MSVRACPKLDNRGLAGFQGCRTLTQLDLALNPHFTDAGVASLRGCASGSTLHRLDLAGCRRVGDGGLSAVAGTFPNVRQLNLDGLVLLHGPGLEEFVLAPPTNPHLQHMMLPDGRPAFSGASLRKLSLAGCASLKRAPLLESVLACEVLRELNLSGVVCVDDGVLADIGSVVVLVCCICTDACTCGRRLVESPRNE